MTLALVTWEHLCHVCHVIAGLLFDFIVICNRDNSKGQWVGLSSRVKQQQFISSPHFMPGGPGGGYQ